MIKKISIITMLVISIAACNSKAKSARDYNNKIVAAEKSLQPDEQATEDKVTNFFNTGQYDSIAVAGEYMERRVQKTIDEINAIPVPDAKGIDIFKTAVIQYFNFFKSIYTAYKAYGLAGTNEKREEVIAQIQELISRKDAVVSDLQSAQRKYADANNFRMDTK